jgi:hypothetical protein
MADLWHPRGRRVEGYGRFPALLRVGGFRKIVSVAMVYDPRAHRHSGAPQASPE